jgi:hypothetical protein
MTLRLACWTLLSTTSQIGGDTNSTDGAESSHEHDRGDLNCDRGYEWWLMEQAKARNANIKLYGLAWGAPAVVRPLDDDSAVDGRLAADVQGQSAVAVEQRERPAGDRHRHQRPVLAGRVARGLLRDRGTVRVIGHIRDQARGPIVDLVRAVAVRSAAGTSRLST